MQATLTVRVTVRKSACRVTVHHILNSPAVYMDDPDAVVSGRRIELARELLLVLNWSILIGCVAGLIVGAIQHDCPSIHLASSKSTWTTLVCAAVNPAAASGTPSNLFKSHLAVICVVVVVEHAHCRTRNAPLRLGCNLHRTG